MLEPPARAIGEGETPPRCRILLIEDEGPIRERLARVIGAWPRGELLAACATLAEAAAIIDGREVDLLVTDLKLPDGHGVHAIRLLRAACPEAEAMVISALADDRSVDRGDRGRRLRLSAQGQRSDRYSRRHRRSSGGPFADLLDDRPHDHSPDIRSRADARAGCADVAERLTPREMDILHGIAKGLTYAELATHLQISRQTVPAHIKNVYRKLQSNNRSEAVYEASRRGLIRL